MHPCNGILLDSEGECHDANWNASDDLMSLETTVLSGRSQTRRATRVRLPLERNEPPRNRRQIRGCQGLGSGEWGVATNGYEVSL